MTNSPACQDPSKTVDQAADEAAKSGSGTGTGTGASAGTITQPHPRIVFFLLSFLSFFLLLFPSTNYLHS